VTFSSEGIPFEVHRYFVLGWSFFSLWFLVSLFSLWELYVLYRKKKVFTDKGMSISARSFLISFFVGIFGMAYAAMYAYDFNLVLNRIRQFFMYLTILSGLLLYSSSVFYWMMIIETLDSPFFSKIQKIFKWFLTLMLSAILVLRFTLIFLPSSATYSSVSSVSGFLLLSSVLAQGFLFLFLSIKIWNKIKYLPLSGPVRKTKIRVFPQLNFCFVLFCFSFILFLF